MNTNTGRAYVEYETKEDMDKAISYMNGVRLGLQDQSLALTHAFFRDNWMANIWMYK